jgi:hypothetical protein
LCADCGKTQDAFDAIAAAVEVAYNSGVTLGDVQDIARDMWPDGCNPNGG